MVNGAAAVRKGNELLDRIGAIARAWEIDEVALQRVQVEARALMDTDAAAANGVMGTVAAIRGDISEVRNRYRIALGLDRREIVWCNYSTSLAVVDEHVDSLAIAKEGLNSYPGDPNLLLRAIEAAAESANFLEADVLCRRWETVAPDRPYPLRGRVRKLAEAVESGLMTEEGAREVIEILTAIQREEGVQTASAEIRVSPDGFLYDRGVRCTPEKASDMNWRMAGEMAARTELWTGGTSVFSAGFVGMVDAGNG